VRLQHPAALIGSRKKIPAAGPFYVRVATTAPAANEGPCRADGQRRALRRADGQQSTRDSTRLGALRRSERLL